MCKTCYQADWRGRNPERVREAHKKYNPGMAGEEAGELFLGVMSRCLGIDCTFEIWQDYLLWLSHETRRTALKNRLAGLIHANQKRYRDEKRAEMVYEQMERGTTHCALPVLK